MSLESFDFQENCEKTQNFLGSGGIFFPSPNDFFVQKRNSKTQLKVAKRMVKMDFWLSL